jgi:hypothetical protein
LRTSDGAQVADVFGKIVDPGFGLPVFATAGLEATHPDSGAQAQLYATASSSGTSAAQAGVPGRTITILDESGHSSFAQVVGPDTPNRIRVAGIYAAAIPALAQGATAAVDVETGITLPARYLAIGLPATVGYGNTYGYTAGGTATAVRILAACPWAGGQPATTFYFAVLMAG